VLLELIFGQKRRGAILEFFFSSLIAHGTKIRRVIALAFRIVGERRTLYSNLSKTQRTLTHYAAR